MINIYFFYIFLVKIITKLKHLSDVDFEFKQKSKKNISFIFNIIWIIGVKKL